MLFAWPEMGRSGISSFLTLGYATFYVVGVAATPILSSRQDAGNTTRPGPHEWERWCDGAPDMVEHPAFAQTIWEEWGVGYWFSEFLQNIDPPDDDWVRKLYQKAMNASLPRSMNGCGTMLDGTECEAITQNDSPVCKKMVENGYPQAVWIFKALAGLHEYGALAKDRTGDQTLWEALGVEELVKTFSAPESDQTVQGLATVIGAAFFLIGGVGGAVSLGLGYASASVARASIQAAEAGVKKATTKVDRLNAESNAISRMSPAARENLDKKLTKAIDDKIAAQDRLDDMRKSKLQSGLESAQTPTDILGAGSCMY